MLNMPNQWNTAIILLGGVTAGLSKVGGAATGTGVLKKAGNAAKKAANKTGAMPKLDVVEKSEKLIKSIN